MNAVAACPDGNPPDRSGTPITLNASVGSISNGRAEPKTCFRLCTRIKTINDETSVFHAISGLDLTSGKTITIATNPSPRMVMHSRIGPPRACKC